MAIALLLADISTEGMRWWWWWWLGSHHCHLSGHRNSVDAIRGSNFQVPETPSLKWNEKEQQNRTKNTNEKQTQKKMIRE